jgi:hypothetical protein
VGAVHHGDTTGCTTDTHQLSGDLLQLEVVLFTRGDEELGDADGGGEAGVEHRLAGTDEDPVTVSECDIECLAEVRGRGTQCVEDVGDISDIGAVAGGERADELSPTPGCGGDRTEHCADCH